MPNMSFADFATKHKPLIDQMLRQQLQQHIDTVTVPDEGYVDLCQQISHLLQRGGKRLRPLLFLLAYQGYGGTNYDDSLSIAVSQELLHAFLLMHDDLIDRDRRRWGGPNITGVYLERYTPTLPMAEALHAAGSQALLAGDICCALANQLLLDSNLQSSLGLRALQLQLATIQQVIAGEVIEMAAVHDATTEEQILNMYERKTASYSFSLPLQLGALYAGADEAELIKLRTLASNMGIAFQLHDDLLGVFGDETVTGKSASSDIREGKRTVLIIKTIAASSPADRRYILAALGNPQLTAAMLDRTKQIIISSGARAYVEKLSRSYLKTAHKQLAMIALHANHQAYLQDLLTLLAIRKR